MAALIGALRISLSADTAAFQSGMKRAERQAKTSASSIQKSLGLVKAGFAGLAAGLSIGAIVQGIKAALDYAGSLGEVSQQLGVTTRDLQVFRYAAGQAGISQEEMDKALGRLTKSMGQAQAGSKSMIAAFNAIGISVDDIRSKDTGEVFRMMADGLSKFGNAADRAVIETTILSRAGQKLDTVLSGGSASIDDYAEALEKMGGILSDDEIQSADLTADKIEQLNNQLKANIAGAVARNSNAILELANSLIFLVSNIGKALTAWTDFKNALDAQAFDIASKNPFLSKEKRAEGAERAARARGKISDSGVGWNVAGSKVIIELPPVNGAKAGNSGSEISQFLGGGGGSRKAKKAPRDTSLRDAFQFEEEQRRLDMDILRAKQDLASDYVARTALSIQMLDLEKESFEADLKYRVAAKELTNAQANQLRAKFDQVDADRRSAVLAEEEAQRREDYNRLDQVDLDLQRDKLDSEAQLAETASERRDIELRLLDLAYRQERARLQAIIAEEEAKDIAMQNWARLEEARRQLANLSVTQQNDRQAVLNSTRGPYEDWMAQLPTTAAKAQEAFERLQVEGFEGLIDAALALSEGFDSAKDALLDTLKQFLLGMARMELQKALGSILPASGLNLGSLFGSIFKGVGAGGTSAGAITVTGLPTTLPGFAFGGFTGSIGRNRVAGFVHGEEGVLNPRGLRTLGVPNLDALNRGVPLSSVSNDNDTRGRVINQNFNVYTPNADSFHRSEGQILRTSRRRLGI